MMQTFDFSFTVSAPIQVVAQFHYDTSALKTLTPPPIFVQLHKIEPLGEGSVSRFTLWFGPLPIRWTAVHSNVSENGFTDTQTAGPAKYWQHTHTFTSLSENETQVHEHIEYIHYKGGRGLLTRMLFAKPALYMMFTYRKLRTRRALKTV